MKFSYKLVFILFGMSAIFSTASIGVDDVKRSQTNYYLASLVSLLLTMFHVYEMIYLCSETNWKLNASYVIANVIFLMLRLNLTRKLNNLKRIASVFTFKEGKGAKMCFYSWVALNTMCHVLIFVAGVKYFNQDGRSYVSNLFGVSEDRNAVNLVSVIFSYHEFVILLLPLTTFAIFFVLVCRHVR